MAWLSLRGCRRQCGTNSWQVVQGRISPVLTWGTPLHDQCHAQLSCLAHTGPPSPHYPYGTLSPSRNRKQQTSCASLGRSHSLSELWTSHT